VFSMLSRGLASSCPVQNQPRAPPSPKQELYSMLPVVLAHSYQRPTKTCIAHPQPRDL
jgi:hypothetical protein